MVFLKGTGDWTKYRELTNLMEVDFHYSDYGSKMVGILVPSDYEPYHVRMDNVYNIAFSALEEAQQKGFDWVLFTHGGSTSRPGRITARSVVRGLMRSKESTPYIVRSKSIQHETVFLAAVRPSNLKLKDVQGGKVM